MSAAVGLALREVRNKRSTGLGWVVVAVVVSAEACDMTGNPPRDLVLPGSH